MRVAALYDVHGNLPALEAVLAELEDVRPDAVLVGGDVVLGPMPAESLDLLRAVDPPARFIRGNTDRGLASGQAEDEPEAWRERHAFAVERLGAERLAFLRELPESIVLDVGGLGPTLFCHGSPRSDEEILTRASTDERLGPILADVAERVVVCGHTHVQFDREALGYRLVNAGSVGMPYEERPGAYWALLGPDVELRRTDYDLEAAAARVRASSFPSAEEFAAENVLAPPGPDEATELFERMASGD